MKIYTAVEIEKDSGLVSGVEAEYKREISVWADKVSWQRIGVCVSNVVDGDPHHPDSQDATFYFSYDEARRIAKLILDSLQSL